MTKRVPHNKLPKEITDAIIKLSKEGLSNTDIAKKLGINRSTVSRYSVNKRKIITDNYRILIVKMFKEGKERFEIAVDTGFSESLIYRLTRDIKRPKLSSTPRPLPPKKRKTEVRKEDDDSMKSFKNIDPIKGRVKVEIKLGLWAYIKNDERFEERLERQKEMHLNR